MSKYDDVRHLHEHGMWPGGVIPEWVRVEAEQFAGDQTSIIRRVEHEMRELERAELVRLRETVRVLSEALERIVRNIDTDAKAKRQNLMLSTLLGAVARAALARAKEQG